MRKQEKTELIKKLSNELKEASSVSLLDFKGMDIITQQNIKKKLKEVKGKMIIAKNTLLRIASDKAKLPEEITKGDILKGQTAIVLGKDDPISPVQVIGKAASESEFVKFKAGIINGVFQDKDSMLAISKLPSKDTLVGQTIGSIASPMYTLISNLQANIQELIGILTAKVG